MVGGFNTQPPEGGCLSSVAYENGILVSTHSRLKAAGPFSGRFSRCRGFNTQPPEGGCAAAFSRRHRGGCFNTQPPEGGWLFQQGHFRRFKRFNTQPPEGGWTASEEAVAKRIVSTHSRLKAAAARDSGLPWLLRFQHTAA